MGQTLSASNHDLHSLASAKSALSHGALSLRSLSLPESPFQRATLINDANLTAPSNACEWLLSKDPNVHAIVLSIISSHASLETKAIHDLQRLVSLSQKRAEKLSFGINSVSTAMNALVDQTTQHQAAIVPFDGVYIANSESSPQSEATTENSNTGIKTNGNQKGLSVRTEIHLVIRDTLTEMDRQMTLFAWISSDRGDEITGAAWVCQTAEWCQGLFAAIAYLHSHGYIHPQIDLHTILMIGGKPMLALLPQDILSIREQTTSDNIRSLGVVLMQILAKMTSSAIKESFPLPLWSPIYTAPQPTAITMAQYSSPSPKMPSPRRIPLSMVAVAHKCIAHTPDDNLQVNQLVNVLGSIASNADQACDVAIPQEWLESIPAQLSFEAAYLIITMTPLELYLFLRHVPLQPSICIDPHQLYRARISGKDLISTPPSVWRDILSMGSVDDHEKIPQVLTADTSTVVEQSGDSQMMLLLEGLRNQRHWLVRLDCSLVTLMIFSRIRKRQYASAHRLIVYLRAAPEALMSPPFGISSFFLLLQGILADRIAHYPTPEEALDEQWPMQKLRRSDIISNISTDIRNLLDMLKPKRNEFLYPQDVYYSLQHDIAPLENFLGNSQSYSGGVGWDLNTEKGRKYLLLHSLAWVTSTLGLPDADYYRALEIHHAYHDDDMKRALYYPDLSPLIAENHHASMWYSTFGPILFAKPVVKHDDKCFYLLVKAAAGNHHLALDILKRLIKLGNYYGKVDHSLLASLPDTFVNQYPDIIIYLAERYTEQYSMSCHPKILRKILDPLANRKHLVAKYMLLRDEFYRNASRLDKAAFYESVRQLSQRLPRAKHLVGLCSAVGFSGKISVIEIFDCLQQEDARLIHDFADNPTPARLQKLNAILRLPQDLDTRPYLAKQSGNEDQQAGVKGEVSIPENRDDERRALCAYALLFKEKTPAAKIVVDNILYLDPRKHPGVYYLVGLFHQEGKYLPKNEERKVYYCKIASDAGWTEATYRVALSMLRGVGVKQDVNAGFRKLDEVQHPYFQNSNSNGDLAGNVDNIHPRQTRKQTDPKTLLGINKHYLWAKIAHRLEGLGLYDAGPITSSSPLMEEARQQAEAGNQEAREMMSWLQWLDHDDMDRARMWLQAQDANQSLRELDGKPLWKRILQEWNSGASIGSLMTTLLTAILRNSSDCGCLLILYALWQIHPGVIPFPIRRHPLRVLEKRIQNLRTSTATSNPAHRYVLDRTDRGNDGRSFVRWLGTELQEQGLPSTPVILSVQAWSEHLVLLDYEPSTVFSNSLQRFETATSAGYDRRRGSDSYLSWASLHAYYLEKGIGQVKDIKKALALYRKTALGDDVWAQFQLGRCCFEGIGTMPSVSEAEFWWEKSREWGHLEGTAWLAALRMKPLRDLCNVEMLSDAAAANELQHSQDEKNDQREALESAINLLRQAASKGQPLAQRYLHQIFARGIGVSRDENIATLWLDLALSQKHVPTRIEQDLLGRS
eukprot:TRINITY_DN1935_c0_g3_i1.p1 TRINITY_DN1935_c0_g3~~TRINITY_DN1935_c0_g3_i1.p1  ORF type:complete len:1486 (-),score=259.73 TRINITY_DN1935_c0_g3_i1:231-4688(-)